MRTFKGATDEQLEQKMTKNPKKLIKHCVRHEKSYNCMIGKWNLNKKQKQKILLKCNIQWPSHFVHLMMSKQLNVKTKKQK